MGRLAKLKNWLDMTKAARMKRAAEQGFGPTLYHGSNNDIGEFFPELGGAEGGEGVAAWLSSSPRVAGTYAKTRMGGGANVMPLKARGRFRESGYAARGDRRFRKLSDCNSWKHQAN